MDYERQVECALETAHQAAVLLINAFHSGFPTDIDKQVDQAICERLTSEFPGYGYHSEELGLLSLPQDECRHLWLVDPQDGSSAAQRGFRGAAVSIALLRDGVPVVGVVRAYCAPDDSGDIFWWAEGFPAILRNNRIVSRHWPTQPSSANTVLVSQDADRNAEVNADLVAPMRYRAIPGIAYRLALVAAGVGDVAVTLNRPVGWDMAGGHALLLGAGGDLYDAKGFRVTYDQTGTIQSVATSGFFGGRPDLVKPLLHRDWSRVFNQTSKTSAADGLCYLAPGDSLQDASLLNRAQGCILGQLAGDALGSLVEFQSASAIQRVYPNGPRLLEDGGTWSTIAGQPTDDSEMALALARSIIQVGGYDPDSAAAAYVNWYESGPFDVGSTTAQALSAASRAAARNLPVALAATAAANSLSQANGALMRISPLGIFGAGLDPSDMFKLGHMDAAITHPHPVCRDASGLMAAVLAHAIQKECSRTGLFDFARELAETEGVEKSVKKAFEAASAAPPHDFSSKQGWVLIALQNAFYQLLHAENLEEGVVATVRCGGDTDTNAAIAGSLLGAVYGRTAIPHQWLDRILACRPLDGIPAVKRPRPAAYWPVDALVLSERLLLAGANRANSWRGYPLPPNRERIPFSHSFSHEEFAKVKAGFKLDGYERWRVFYREPWLEFCRSWTGICVYRVRLDLTPSGAAVAEVWVNRDAYKYGVTNMETDQRRFRELIDLLLQA